ncbi:MAG: hypothetical protein VKP72_08610 [bacterium]|nr:hypothetical protein [bacterium]
MMCLRLVLPAACLLAACSLATTPVARAPQDTATIELTPRLTAAGRQTQALIEPWKASDVDHLRVVLYMEDATPSGALVAPQRAVLVDGMPVMTDLAQADLDDPVRFSGLRRNTIYWARASAYRGPDSIPQNLISVEDGSRLRLPVREDDRLLVATLTVQFADRVFAGEASPDLVFLGGGLVAAGPLTLIQASPSSAPAAFRIRSTAAR